MMCRGVQNQHFVLQFQELLKAENNQDHLKESPRLLNVTFPHLKHSCDPESK